MRKRSAPTAWRKGSSAETLAGDELVQVPSAAPLANGSGDACHQRLMPAARQYRIVPAQPVLRSAAIAAGLVMVR